MHISCFPFNTKTTTLISIVFSSSLLSFIMLFLHRLHCPQNTTTTTTTTKLPQFFSPRFYCCPPRHLFLCQQKSIVVLQTEHNLKELRKTIISRCFIFIFILYLLVAWYLFLRNNPRLVTYHSCLLAFRWTPRLAAWYKVSSEIRLWQNPLGDCTAPFFMLCVGKKPLSRW